MTTEAERLATLESQMLDVRSDVADIRASLKAIERIAASGSGILHTVLIVGGMVGWLAGIAVTLYTSFRH